MRATPNTTAASRLDPAPSRRVARPVAKNIFFISTNPYAPATSAGGGAEEEANNPNTA
jgi:hypothetical protein